MRFAVRAVRGSGDEIGTRTSHPCQPGNHMFAVDLMGRLSNPPEAIETLTGQGFHGPRRHRKVDARRLREGPAEPETFAQETTGRLSNPGPRPIQRRLNTTDITRLVTGYRDGQSLSDLAKEFCIHHRTVAAHLEQCGIPRRINARKFTNNDVDQAARRYRAGESLATVANAFNVNAATVRRELHRAGVTIRPRRRWN